MLPEQLDSEREKENPADKANFEHKKEQNREKLLRELEEFGIPNNSLEKLKESMKLLEDRAKTEFDDDIPDRELAKFYTDISSLLSAKEPHVSKECIQALAEQMIHQAAKPAEISQGFNNTCNVTTLENVLYSRNPSLVSHVVTSAALTGKFTTADGSTIQLSERNLKPDANALSPQDGERSYASKLFQETAINTFWQRQTIAPNGAAAEKGTIKYSKGTAIASIKNDTGERLTGVDGVWLKDEKGIIKSPHLGLPQMQDIFEQIAGQTPVALFIDRTQHYKDKPGIIIPNSAAELHGLLKELKEGSKYGRLPVIVEVPGHVMVIRDYDQVTGKVMVDNSWNKETDYFGKSGTLPQKTVQGLFKDILYWDPKNDRRKD